MENQFERTELLLGKDAIQKLENAHVAVFGVGGVGGKIWKRRSIYHKMYFSVDA
mgnify:CR=1 FL=1